MNRKNGVSGIVLTLFAALFILAGCEQSITPEVSNRDNTGDNTIEKDSLLIEVWDSSTPPKFLGYYTGIGNYGGSYNNSPIILTSKGYCVQLSYSSIGRDEMTGADLESRTWYGQRGFTDMIPSAEAIELRKKDGWGHAIFFNKASNPTDSDTPYAWWSSDIVNNVMYHPRDGGTYYTWDNNATRQDITIQANYTFYDFKGAIHTWNDDVTFVETRDQLDTKYFIGKTETFTPFKKIGGYAELGLPNPNDVKGPWVFKVR